MAQNIVPQGYMLEATGPVTPKNVSSPERVGRKRKLAEAMMQQGMDTSPVQHWSQALARVMQGGIGGYMEGKAARDEEAGRQAYSSKLQAALAGGTPSLAQSADLMSDPWASEGGSRLAGVLAEHALPKGPSYKTISSGDNVYRIDESDPNSKPVLLVKGSPKATTGQQDYNFYVEQEKAAGRQPVDFFTFTKAKAPQITNTVGGESDDAAFRKSLATESGKNWGEIEKSGQVAGSMMQDMEVLDELIEMAPQGPIVGRLAGSKLGQGFSSAGAAFNGIVKRVAPTLRTPGSGATSDIEYEGMLQSLPQLSNRPEANRAISAMMKAKAQINIERGQIVSAYAAKRMSYEDARAKMTELNSRSILSPELRELIVGLDPGQSSDPEVDDLVNQYGGSEEQ